MYDIDSEIERRKKCWNDRFKQCLKDRNMTQAGFADALNKQYNTNAYSQKTVNRWMRVGNPTKGIKNLPEYETMIKIANVLNVEVGYLTGETDGENYDAQRTADYLNLTIKTIHSIKQITDRGKPGKTTVFRRPIPLLASRMYEKLLTAEGFGPFLAQMEDLDLEYDKPMKMKHRLEHIADGKDPAIYDKISKYIGYPFDPDEDPGFSDEELAAYHELNDAVDDAYAEEQNREVVMDFLRYRLLKAYEKLVEELYP